ncbi:TPA: hypothetical protein KOR75_001223 [Clostridioides difficile]|nr:hypothetical protein [Clostridioides difficile]
MNVQQSLDEMISDLTLEECNIGLQLIDKYLKKETIREVTDDGAIVDKLLFPSIIHVVDALGMAKGMRSYEANRMISYVIESNLIYLNQTPEGRERKKQLEEAQFREVENRAITIYLYTIITNRIKQIGGES